MGKLKHIPELMGGLTFFVWQAQIVFMLGCGGVYNHISDSADPLDLLEYALCLPEPADPLAPMDAERRSMLEWLREDAVAKDIHAVDKKILSLQMSGEKDVEHYLGEHDAFKCDLVWMGVAYSDDEAIINLFMGLPCTGTWLAFKLLLQSSLQSGRRAAGSSSSAHVSKKTGSSSISAALSTGGLTFEEVSVRIVAELHHLLMESGTASLLGTEFANAAQPQHPVSNVNPTTGLHHTQNNPSGTICDTPLQNGGICRASNHDHAHCLKPGGRMAGQQPAHWNKHSHPQSSTSSTTPAVVTPTVPPTPPIPPAPGGVT
ncbi:hypothetical protein ID866_12098 [Astraeus odoratus]|nr:hypothetical protein ID866_12098 [Astraeus odoratus]